MNERGCPPDYNGGFCADYDVDCKACWEQWEQEHKTEVDYSSITAHLNSSRMVAGTACQICDEFIPLYGHQQAYSRICNECKKRLKKLLYGESEDE